MNGVLHIIIHFGIQVSGLEFESQKVEISLKLKGYIKNCITEGLHPGISQSISPTFGKAIPSLCFANRFNARDSADLSFVGNGGFDAAASMTG